MNRDLAKTVDALNKMEEDFKEFGLDGILGEQSRRKTLMDQQFANATTT